MSRHIVIITHYFLFFSLFRDDTFSADVVVAGHLEGLLELGVEAEFAGETVERGLIVGSLKIPKMWRELFLLELVPLDIDACHFSFMLFRLFHSFVHKFVVHIAIRL